MSERIDRGLGPVTDRLFVARPADDAVRRYVLPRISACVLLACAGLVTSPVLAGVAVTSEPGSGQLLFITLALLIAVVAVGLLLYAARYWQERAAAEPVVVDPTGISLPVGASTVFLPWDTLRSVVATRGAGNTVFAFRTRPLVTPQHPGVHGMHGRWVWPLASGPGIPVETRLLDTTPAELAAAIDALSDGKIRVLWQ
jgi:hypothetical protein